MKTQGMALAGLLTLGLIFSAGCGGGGGGGNNSQPNILQGSLQTGDKAFSDGSYVDFYICSASSSGTATVEMNSAQVDSFLLAGIDDANGNIQTIATDDNSGGGRNAKVSFNITAGTTYHIAATTAANGQSGSYTLIYSSNLTNFRADNTVSAQLRQMHKP